MTTFTAITANNNGDDWSHLTAEMERPRIVFTQETNYALMRGRYPLMKHLRPVNGQYHLGISVTRGDWLKVEDVSVHQAHPSAREMARYSKWNVAGEPWDVRHIPTPPRGALVVRAVLDGVPTGLVCFHPINSGHTHHPDQWTPARRYAADLCWAVVEEQVAKLHAEGRKVLAGADANWTAPPPPTGLVKVGGRGLDLLWGTRGAFVVTGHSSGPAAGHKGKVHHKSEAARLTLKGTP